MLAPTNDGRAALRVGLACNNRCAFCAQAPDDASGTNPQAREPSPEAIDANLVAARVTHSELTFVGGEPTLDEALEERIRRAAALGFRKLGVQTNGSRLADASYTAKLARAGLTDVHLSLHGSDAAVHDYHSGRPGSFDEVLAAANAARDNALAVVVTTVLTRSNFRVLSLVPDLLRAHGVRGWFMAVPVLAGRAHADRDRVAPRLGLAMPFALQAVAAASARNLLSWVVGAPLCLLGPYASHALRPAASGDRAYAELCATCPARPSCPGVDATYLARFGGDELFAREAPVVGESTRDPASSTAAMFVGDGALAMPTPALAAPPARARVALPVLGRVKPAVAEATAGTERRTGEALKEILPALFDGSAK